MGLPLGNHMVDVDVHLELELCSTEKCLGSIWVPPSYVHGEIGILYEYH